METSSLPEVARVELVHYLSTVNKLAKQASTQEQKHRLYEMKHDALSTAILQLSNKNVLLSYERNARGAVDVVVAITALEIRTYHVPFERLTKDAQRVISATLGPPSFYLRQCNLEYLATSR